MTSLKEYASMMDLPEPIVRHFLVGLEKASNETIINELLKLKSLASSLDAGIVEGIVVSKSGNQVATLECLKQLVDSNPQIAQSQHIEKNRRERDASSERHRERGFFGWIFGGKQKHKSRSTSKSADNDGIKEGKHYHHKDQKTDARSVREAAGSDNTGASVDNGFIPETNTPTAPSREASNLGRATPPCPYVVQRAHGPTCPEEVRLSMEYNFASASKGARVNVVPNEPETGDDFQAIFSQFMQTASKS